MNGDADEVVRTSRGWLTRFERAWTEDLVDVVAVVFEHHVDTGHGAEVAAVVHKRYPRRLHVLAVAVDHLEWLHARRIGRVRRYFVGPVGKGRSVVRAQTAGVVVLEAVRDGDAVLVAIQTGYSGEQVVRGVRDERRVLVGQQRAAALEEIEEVRHLLQIGLHIWIVA